MNCTTDRFSANSVVNPLSLNWKFRSTKSEFEFDIPYAIQTDNVANVGFLRRKSVFGRGYGPLSDLYGKRVWDYFQPADNAQGLFYVMELIAGPARNAVYYDPTLSMRVLFDESDPGADPNAPAAVAQAQETASVNLAVAIAVPIVVVALIAVIGVVALVPAIRRKIFGFENALHTAKMRQTESKRALESGTVQPAAQDRSLTRSDSSWRAARPNTDAEVRNSFV
jgi:hypothetical protein